MNFYGNFKRKYQRYAIQNLPLYAALTFGLGWLLTSTSQGAMFYANYLMFYPSLVLRGQIWRIVTAFLYPPFAGSSIFMALLGIYIYYNFASIVERMMGAFDFNVYFFGSFFIGEIGSIIYYLISGNPIAPYLPVYTQFAVFMAFAILYPEANVLLMFVLPIKIKYLAYAELVIYLYSFVMGDSMSRLFGMLYTRINIIAALIPIGLFYLFVHYGQGGNVIGNLRWKLHQKRRQREWRDQWK